MSASFAPVSVTEMAEVVRSSARVLPLGAGTKPRLSAVDVRKISTLRMTGIVEYEPSEFTFTALAGTSLQELTLTLASRGQYLPFDPLLLQSGATLGGTVAAGLSGPGRLRFGGLRDFILGTQLVDGMGRVLRMGGKVVKNAAGFDVPKFLVGSLGRFGVITELTFKVFPAPRSSLTLRLAARDTASAARILIEAARARWEPEALEIPACAQDVLLRLKGPDSALQEMGREILGRWPGEKLTETDALSVWSTICEFKWAHVEGPLIKVALYPAVVPGLHHALQSIEGIRIHIGSGGDMAFISLPNATRSAELSKMLQDFKLSGVALRGEGPLWWGLQPRSAIAQGVKLALDPENRFPGLDE